MSDRDLDLLLTWRRAELTTEMARIERTRSTMTIVHLLNIGPISEEIARYLDVGSLVNLGRANTECHRRIVRLNYWRDWLIEKMQHLIEARVKHALEFYSKWYRCSSLEDYYRCGAFENILDHDNKLKLFDWSVYHQIGKLFTVRISLPPDDLPRTHFEYRRSLQLFDKTTIYLIVFHAHAHNIYPVSCSFHPVPEIGPICNRCGYIMLHKYEILLANKTTGHYYRCTGPGCDTELVVHGQALRPM